MQKTRIALIAVIGLAFSSSLPAALAAPSLEEIQVKVQTLQEEATSAAEGAQAARVQLDALTRTLNGIKQQAAAQGQTSARVSNFSFPVIPLSISPQLVRSMRSLATRPCNCVAMQQLLRD